ncbi:MAG: hypothetical protein EPN25_08055, partial [Nitrospirae bacterium]
MSFWNAASLFFLLRPSHGSSSRRVHQADYTMTDLYLLKRANACPGMDGDWDSPAWAMAETLELTHFRPEGSDHRPRTFVRLLYDAEGISGIFRVEDRYVLSRLLQHGDPVYKDSCVEFFVRPKEGRGYFNFEFNAGGRLLCSYIVDPARAEGGFKEFSLLPQDDAGQVRICHSLPPEIGTEIPHPVVWTLEFFVPLSLLEKYAGRIGNPAGTEWRANFYKCADGSSHPHWASWQQ